MHARFAAVAVAISVAVIAVACGSEEPTVTPADPTQPPPTSTAEPQNFTVAFSDRERVDSPDVPDSDLEQLVAGNNEFALNMYRQLAGMETGNTFMSP